MFFTVIQGAQTASGASRAFLRVDHWDDWSKYRTMFTLFVMDEEGIEHRIGSVKIGQVGLLPAGQVQPGQRAPSLPEEFDVLEEGFFSLGQGEDYYASLNELSPELKERVFVGLRDCAFDLAIFEAHLNETVMTESLLRNVQRKNVRTRLNRLTKGDAQLTKFHFRYTLPEVAGAPPTTLSFNVAPDSLPPTNVHVLIGRNGVGKTRCMRQLAETLLGREDPNGLDLGSIELVTDIFEAEWSFAGLIMVSFSAFDYFDLVAREGDAISSQQVGLRHRVTNAGVETIAVKSPADLASDFRASLEKCALGLTAQRWREAILTLESDDLFAEAEILSLIDRGDGESEDDWKVRAEGLFSKLSSGHAIVLLTVTKLVELVDEKTLVLLDEPESHLHPPLLSAFIRCLSTLLVRRNGVAIVATHSPVVLQEVPKSCAWKLRRSHATSVAERPAIETFGENVGILTREVFGFEITRSGFHQMISSAVAEGLTFDQLVHRFQDHLGYEARAIAQALIADRDQE